MLRVCVYIELIENKTDPHARVALMMAMKRENITFSKIRFLSFKLKLRARRRKPVNNFPIFPSSPHSHSCEKEKQKRNVKLTIAFPFHSPKEELFFNNMETLTFVNLSIGI